MMNTIRGAIDDINLTDIHNLCADAQFGTFAEVISRTSNTLESSAAVPTRHIIIIIKLIFNTIRVEAVELLVGWQLVIFIAHLPNE